MDVFGHHASVCPTKGDRIRRHNVLRDIIYEIFALLHLGVLKKTPPIFPSSSEKLADIYVPNYSLGKDLGLDVVVSCPL